ncbi:hypothetical protein A0H81_13411 [Grifola frondosa]|uniref:Cation/H+ exchanger transmembrane domain-containing protein n=1 Tax=Grifola frondosa TaxID=5627 RepID=A0A1C7LPJ0_GRIFR|nr:hypothetical protein A0H81_13411 [Grifola frondosa]
MMPAAIVYVQPSLQQLLVISSFIYLLLNAVRVVADFALHGGIIAELALGIIYGGPISAILPIEWEKTFTILGYVGLICIVFEGGLSTNLPLLLSNLPLSCICALTGVMLPIAFSFALLYSGYGYRPLEAFAAGATLSSTSLGTTVAALNSVTKGRGCVKGNERSATDFKEEERTNMREPHACCNGSSNPSPSPSIASSLPSSQPLQQTRIGTVLISAAIIDDVMGLVIASLIPALTTIDANTSSLNEHPQGLAWTVIHPLLSSLLIALISPIIARFVLRPAFWFRGYGERWCAPRRRDQSWAWDADAYVNGWGAEDHADAVKLFVMIVFVSAFAAIAYYTGSSVLLGAYVAGLTLSYMEDLRSGEARKKALSFEIAYARILGPIQQYILAPLFFASLGYAIPFLSLWNRRILWRGVLYAVLMCIGKLAVGIPIIVCRAKTMPPHIHPPGQSRNDTPMAQQEPSPRQFASRLNSYQEPRDVDGCTSSLSGARMSHTCSTNETSALHSPTSRTSMRARLKSSIFPAAFISVAMVARGEIGLLIAQIARQGVEATAEDAGLLGPIGVGFVVSRCGAQITEEPGSNATEVYLKNVGAYRI